MSYYKVIIPRKPSNSKFQFNLFHEDGLICIEEIEGDSSIHFHIAIEDFVQFAQLAVLTFNGTPNADTAPIEI